MSGRYLPNRLGRIAVIGDSFTWGQGVSEDDRLTNLLQERLNDGAGGFEVFNFGLPGADTRDESAILSEVLSQAAPDVVLPQWFVNDVFPWDRGCGYRPELGSEPRHRPRGPVVGRSADTSV